MPYVYPYDHRHDLDPAAITLLLGGKAANIATMAVDLGLPVPPAFTITTEACKAYLASGWPDGLDGEIRSAMTGLEARVGRRFGDPADPLLVSVRSGAPRSMPGMMDTILNLGLNRETEAGLAAASGDAGFARNCHDRFHAIYRSVVGVEIVPLDPWAQLRGAVEAVFNSWNSARARAYREVEGISGDLGTGVTVQAMVFGNRGRESGTGVLFTRNPATGEHALYGDVMFDAQGEDVVAGTHATEPVSCLDTRMPGVAAELRRHANVLERHYRDCCDIEFTIERGRLWMLQVRVGKRTPQAALRISLEMAEDLGFPLTREEAVRRVIGYLADPPKAVVDRGEARTALATGLGASPGLVSGEIRLTPEDAVEAADAGRDVILVRAETSPDDVHGMQRSCGILTSTGGFASHAAVVARGWGIPAVVGATDVVVGDGAVVIGGRELPAGTVISIDGSSGEVFEGVAAGVEAVVPEAKVLLGWARELGIDVDEPDAPADPVGDRVAGEPPAGAGPTTDDALRMLVVRDYRDAAGMAVALGCPAEESAAVLDLLVADGLAEPSAGAFRLTPAGRSAGSERIAQDAEAWGVDGATAALDAFIVLDRRVKEVATAWQLRDGKPNDHADAAYDAEVLGSLAPLHADVEAWLARATGGLARLAQYGVRLGAAAAAVAGGNGKYIASPRVDSYHGAWFELHEDLILLAGRNRKDEVAAGRA
ncbi:MAG TPA: pyruvate, phosphate dikinase [Candidatus Limnocylindrales bacterium]|nr:pyruvate, phosphate dikinase [Candidatus Limnocylindrales bacterium]